MLMSNENAVSFFFKQQSFSASQVQTEVTNWALLYHKAEDKTTIFVVRDLEVWGAEKYE